MSNDIQAIPATAQGFWVSKTLLKTSAMIPSWITHRTAEVTSDVPILRPNAKDIIASNAMNENARAILDHVKWVFEPEEGSSILDVNVCF
jgi:hypothetical protein